MDTMETLAVGSDAKFVGWPRAKNKEFMFWQYLPIKLAGKTLVDYPCNLNWTASVVLTAMKDFSLNVGNLDEHYVYLTAKSLYVTPNNSGNRPGWHVDGFMTEDTNYIWTDKNPTEVWYPDGMLTNVSRDHNKSMKEMKSIVNTWSCYIKNLEVEALYRLDNKCLHRVSTDFKAGFRNFIKISFSKEKYLGESNSINYTLDYDWSEELVARNKERNCPHGVK
jgi:hypothetical protein